MNMDNFYVYHLVDPSTQITFYVGKGIKRRMYDHERDTIRGIIPNNNFHLFYKIKKILSNSGRIEYKKVLENIDEKKALLEESVEIKKIGRKDLGLGPLCNLTDGGEGSSGFHHSKDHIERLKLFNPGGTKTSKLILQFDLNGNFIKTWKSIRKISKELNLVASSLSNSSKKLQTYKGYIWICNNDERVKIVDNKILNIDIFKIRNGKKKLIQKDLSMNIIKVWNSISDACNQLNIKPSAISWSTKNNKIHKGFYWKIYE